MLQIAVHDRMHIQMVDTKAAYLCQKYPQDATPLYVMLPKRVAEVLELDPNQTYRVLQYIYGLPDAGRAYYDAYSEHLISNGYHRTASDPCLFFKILGSRRRVYIWIHVDDTLIAADDLRDIEEFKEVMRKRFEITVNEEADHHLGVNIHHLPDGSLKLMQDNNPTVQVSSSISARIKRSKHFLMLINFIGGQGLRLGVRRAIATVYGVKQRPVPVLSG